MLPPVLVDLHKFSVDFYEYETSSWIRCQQNLTFCFETVLGNIPLLLHYYVTLTKANLK